LLHPRWGPWPSPIASAHQDSPLPLPGSLLPVSATLTSSPPRTIHASMGGHSGRRHPAINRRTFLTMLALAVPVTAEAHQPRKTAHVVILGPQQGGPTSTAFRQRLAELGYSEGANVEIAILSDDGVTERTPVLASQVVERKPDVIVAVGPPAAYAVRKLTT